VVAAALLVVRHAIAEDRDAAAARGLDDGDRPLTDEGRRRMERGARALARLVPEIGPIASSPLLRAWQTAEILRDALAEPPEVVACEALLPAAAPAELVGWLARIVHRRAAVAVVGHEPHLGLAVSWLLAGDDRSFVRLKKGAACLVELPALPGPGSARLLWSLAPAQLRALAE
jgi:phosphohistidine phosphatase